MTTPSKSAATRLEIWAGGVIGALVLVGTGSVILRPAPTEPAQAGILVLPQSLSSTPLAQPARAHVAPKSAPDPAPLTVENILPARPGEPSVATIRLPNGEAMSVSAGTTIGDDIVVLGVDSDGMDIRLHGAPLRLNK